jgi:peptidyl-prolyl cis-trans isomerase B (cyclophilin B)
VSQHSPYEPAGPVQAPDHAQGRPAYGQGAPGYPPAGPQKTNTMAILGLVFAFLFQPLGIVFSAIGLSQIKKTRENGRGLALAGLILSIVFMILGLILFFFVFAALNEVAKTAAAEESLAAEETLGADAGEDADGVLAACETVIPAISAFGTDMETVTTPEEYVAVVTDTRTAIEGAAAGASDPVFVQDVQMLSDDLQLAADSVAAGEDPSYLMDALTEDEARVNDACIAAGY